MDVFTKIKALFDSGNVEYEVIEHAPVFTSDDAAKIRDTSIEMGAKALVWFADKHPILVVVPGDSRLDVKKFKSAFNVKDLRFATPDEVEKLTGLKIGSIPPLGKALGLKSYYDSSFESKDFVAFNAGLHTISIKLKATDLLWIENPLKASII